MAETEASEQINIYRPDDCYGEMKEQLHNGKPKGTTTHNESLDECWKWRKRESNIWTGYANEGKALDIYTSIPTTLGMILMKDIEVGHTVFDEKGNSCKVTAVTDIMYDRPCYKITFSDNTWVVADANHQWVVDDEQSRGSKARQSRRKETQKRGSDQRNKCLQSMTLKTEWMIPYLKKGNKLNYSIANCKPVNYDKQKLVIDPYLLGAWLGDGTKGAGQITGADEEIIDEFRKAGFTITKNQSKYTYGVLKFKVKLRQIGVLKSKHIPWEYLHSSVEDRLALLQGLMDTDGFTDNLGRCEFTVTDWHLQAHVHQLITSLGIKVYFTEDIAKLNGVYISQRYRLRFKTDLPVFRLNRKLQRQMNARRPKNNHRLIQSIESVESRAVKCIQVDSPSHMYLCTEHFIPTHNSLMIKQLCSIKAIKDGWRFLISSPEDFPPEEFFDDMIHTITGITTDRDHEGVVSDDIYDAAYELIRDKFVFVYFKPPNNTIKRVLEEFRRICGEEQIDACIIDPVLKFAWPKDFPDNYERYSSYIGSLMVDFCRETNTSANLVMHQVTPLFVDSGFKTAEGSPKMRYAEPSMYRVKGGGSWADGFDNVLSIWRPNYAFDKIDTEVQFCSQKIKKQKLVGIPQRLRMRFNRRTNRYRNFTDDTDMFDFDTELFKVMDRKVEEYLQQQRLERNR
jgi:hypothetical protein